jgi:glycosyltransferase involved in cell wall biosynthesis
MKYDLAVIMPIFHNGLMLAERAIPSLQKSKAFSKMRVYLIDDGGDDGETTQVINRLCSENENFTSFSFSDGGSGGAGRPRNKGIELATERWLAFADPDNENYDDFYYHALEKANDERKPDMIISQRPWLISSNGKMQEFEEFGLDDEDEFVDIKFPYEISPQNTSILARKNYNVMQSITRKDFLQQFMPCYIENYGHEDTLLEHLIACGKKLSKSSEFKSSKEFKDYRMEYPPDFGGERILLETIPNYTLPKVLRIPRYNTIYHIDTEGSQSNEVNLLKKLASWAPAVSYCFEITGGYTNVWYAMQSLLELAKDEKEYCTALEYLSHIYDYSSRSMQDDSARWIKEYENQKKLLYQKYILNEFVPGAAKIRLSFVPKMIEQSQLPAFSDKHV